MWGGTDQFYPYLQEGRQKKRFSSWPFTFFRGTSLARGEARSLPGGARRNLMVQISLLAQKFGGEVQVQVILFVAIIIISVKY